jgi:hypothetical protein
MIAALIRERLRARGPMPRANTNTVVDFIRVGEALDIVATDKTLDPEWDAADDQTQKAAAGLMWDAAFQAIGGGGTVREAAAKVAVALLEFLRATKGGG